MTTETVGPPSDYPCTVKVEATQKSINITVTLHGEKDVTPGLAWNIWKALAKQASDDGYKVAPLPVVEAK